MPGACACLGAEVIDPAGGIGQVYQFGVAGEQHYVVCGGGYRREAVRERDRRSSLKARGLDHPGRSWKIRRELTAEI
ncbi:MAG: hypothetical protein M0T77_01680, partial [Actinomycetota bacterium]|nr:hypothetical protein [Actinomycetota bacterium]